MPIYEKFVKESIRKTLSNMKCKSCGQQYESANVCFRGHREDCWFVSIYCPSCRVLIPGIVHVGMGDISEGVTHVSETESSEVSTPIDSNDVADMHAFLKDFSGDFCSLFSET